MCGLPSVAHIDSLKVEIEYGHIPSVVRFLLIINCYHIDPRVFECDILSQKGVNLDRCLIRIKEGFPIERIEVEGGTLRDHAVVHVFTFFREVLLPAVCHDIRLPLIEVKVHEHVIMFIL